MSFVRRVIHDILCAARLRIDAGVWVLPDQVLACAYPRTSAALAGLAASGVRLVVNLHPRAHASAALARHNLTELHLPTPAFRAPSFDMLLCGVRAIEDALAAGRRVAVHCGSGRGRAGTLIACFLVARGATATAALTRVRRARAGAVETRAQEIAVRAFERAYQPIVREPPNDRCS